MASCKHDGGTSTRTYDITVGPEIVTYECTTCNKCGVVISNVIIYRRPK